MNCVIIKTGKMVMEEKRGIEEYCLTVPAKVSVMNHNNQLHGLQAYTKDVSSRGTFLQMVSGLEIGQRVFLELYLSINKLQEFFELDNSVRIEVSGQVVRSTDDGVGIQFDKKYTILPSNGGC